MKITTAEAYYRKHHEACRKHLKRYAKRANSADLHGLRVSIKKIKAIFVLARDLDHLDIEAYFSCYRILFHQAGVIRSATLLRDRIATVTKDKQAIARRTHHIAVLNKKFKSEIPLYLKDLNECVEDAADALRAYEHDTLSYTRDLLKKLKKKWRKTDKKGNYHSLRKHLKQYLYSTSLLTSAELKSLIPDKEIKLIDKLQDLIGSWHDDADISAHILSDISGSKIIERTITAEKKKLQKKIIRIGDKIWGK